VDLGREQTVGGKKKKNCVKGMCEPMLWPEKAAAVMRGEKEGRATSPCPERGQRERVVTKASAHAVLEQE